MRGTYDRDNKGFKCDVAGNDKRYGFNVWNEESSEVMVFEAAIDLMSYMDIRSDYETNKIALGILSDAPLEPFKNYNQWLQAAKKYIPPPAETKMAVR